MSYNKGITPDYIKECFEYNPETGILTWKERPRHHFKSDKMQSYFSRRYSGKPATNINPQHGYMQVNLNYHVYLVHWLIFVMHHGYIPKNSIKRLDGDKLNNRIENLYEHQPTKS